MVAPYLAHLGLGPCNGVLLAILAGIGERSGRRRKFVSLTVRRVKYIRFRDALHTHRRVTLRFKFNSPSTDSPLSLLLALENENMLLLGPLWINRNNSFPFVLCFVAYCLTFQCKFRQREMVLKANVRVTHQLFLFTLRTSLMKTIIHSLLFSFFLSLSWFSLLSLSTRHIALTQSLSWGECLNYNSVAACSHR